MTRIVCTAMTMKSRGMLTDSRRDLIYQVRYIKQMLSETGGTMIPDYGKKQ